MFLIWGHVCLFVCFHFWGEGESCAFFFFFLRAERAPGKQTCFKKITNKKSYFKLVQTSKSGMK